MNSFIDKAGVVRTYSGAWVDIANPDPATLNINDIAWCLGRILRYNGAIKQDYTVAHHSIIMSYYVPEMFALEALLHDAGEAYMGDITWPVKQMFPAIEEAEHKLTGVIMEKFMRDRVDTSYVKSPLVATADEIIYQHECFSFGDRPGVFNQKMQIAWTKAVDESDNLWHAPYYPFLFRFHELTGTGRDREQIMADVAEEWYGASDLIFEGIPDETAEQILMNLDEALP